MKEFRMTSHWPVPGQEPKQFNEETAPKWLREGGPAGSTMCNRWFWNGHVLTLAVGQTVKTDFQTIERTK